MASNLPTKGDIPRAHRMLHYIEGLTRGEAKVASLILSHLNRRTGRCDPSVARLAELAKMSRATVLRATKTLSTGPYRLFDKAVHGGLAHRSSYTPRWKVFREHEAAFDALWRRVEYDEGVTDDTLKVSPMTHEGVTGDTLTSTETSSVNHADYPAMSSEASARGLSSRGVASRADEFKQLTVAEGHRQRRTARQSREKSPALKAQERWYATALERLSPDAFGRLVEWITDDAAQAATLAERKQLGGGVAVLANMAMTAGLLDLAAALTERKD